MHTDALVLRRSHCGDKAMAIHWGDIMEILIWELGILIKCRAIFPCLAQWGGTVRGFLLRAGFFLLLSWSFLCVDPSNSPSNHTKSSQRKKKKSSIPVVFQLCKIRTNIFPCWEKILQHVFPNARRFGAHKAYCFQRAADCHSFRNFQTASRYQLKITPPNLPHSVHAKHICAAAIPRCVNK